MNQMSLYLLHQTALENLVKNLVNILDGILPPDWSE